MAVDLGGRIGQEAHRLAELNDRGEIRAAGGVVWRRADGGGVEVALIHRPKYDDWSIPKGKAERGETDEACALREVEEETGLRCRLGPELPTVRYRDRFDRPKAARYWAMQALSGEFRPHDEVDELSWHPLDEAVEHLTYDHDRVVVQAVPDAVRHQ